MLHPGSCIHALTRRCRRQAAKFAAVQCLYQHTAANACKSGGEAHIENVLVFLQDALPEIGWMETTSKDSVIGSLGSMARVNDNEDNLSISMNYNPGGMFTQVLISVSRTVVE